MELSIATVRLPIECFATFEIGSWQSTIENDLWLNTKKDLF